MTSPPGWDPFGLPPQAGASPINAFAGYQPPGQFDYPPTVRPVPATIWVAVGALVMCAMASLAQTVASVLGILKLKSAATSLMKLDPTDTAESVAASYVSGLATTFQIIVVILGVIFTGMYLLVARAVKRGSRWPLIFSTIAAVISLPGLLFGPFVLVAVLCGFVAVIAMWTASARQYAR